MICNHENFDEYFEICSDCNTELIDMPLAIQQAYQDYLDLDV